MKNILNIVLALSIMFCMNACDDVLDKDPSTSLPTEDAITSIEDLKNAINGVYEAQAYNRGSYAADFTLYADLCAGDFQSISNNNHAGVMYRYQITPNDELASSFYTVFYALIARLNNVMSQLTKFEENEVAGYKGELYAIRGLYHFDLARLYAKAPTNSTTSDLGIILSDEVYDTKYIGERTSIQETYNFIIDDLTTALSLLPKNVTIAETLGHMNYWSTLGIRARAYLYLGKYSEALADCKEIISSSPYKLYTIEEYPSVWLKEGTNESMFEILTTSNYNAQRNSIGYYTHASGYGECAFTDSFLKELQNRSNDVRSTLTKFEDDNGYNGTYPQKYNGRDGQIYVNNPKVIRLSEVYLIAAEAALQGGNPAEATTYMNTLRKNRITDYKDVTSVTLDDILMERRLELFAEGHTAWDYWRNGKSVKNNFVGEVKPNDYRTILPLPTSEIEVSYGKLIQNPGYSVE